MYTISVIYFPADAIPAPRLPTGSQEPKPMTLMKNTQGNYCLYTRSTDGGLKCHELRSHPGAPRKVCAFCKYSGERFSSGNIKQTSYWCLTCDVHLCRPQVRDCFANYHKMRYPLQWIFVNFKTKVILFKWIAWYSMYRMFVNFKTKVILFEWIVFSFYVYVRSVIIMVKELQSCRIGFMLKIVHL